MRPIKFRAWYKFGKRMIDLQKITPLALSYPDHKGLFLPFDDNTILMQFTGLLDKKGKEIYEGDVVVQDGYIWFDEGEPNYIGTVEWVFSQWQVIAHCVNQHKRGISDGINYGLNDEGWEDGEETTWEVIGNICEGFPGQETKEG